MFLFYLILVGLAILIALILFIFDSIWYSKFLFGAHYTKKHENMKVALAVEFLSCFLFAIGAMVVFIPFDLYIGFDLGLIIALTIIFPFAISEAVWKEGSSFKTLVASLLHRSLQMILTFTLAGAANSFLFPMVSNYNSF